jgi:hypothetical protein
MINDWTLFPLGSNCNCPVVVLKKTTAPGAPFNELVAPVRTGRAVPVATADQVRPEGVVPLISVGWGGT